LSTALAVGLFAFTGVITGCGGDSDSGGEQQALSLLAPKSDVAYADLGETGSDAGDLRSFTMDLYEDGNDQSVGRLDGTVALTDIDELNGRQVEYRSGQVQFTLGGGTIVALGNYVAEPGESGPVDEGSIRAIVGGTGDYSGASGEVISSPGGGDEIDFELTFTLPDEG
jgi:hypothetical protein